MANLQNKAWLDFLNQALCFTDEELTIAIEECTEIMLSEDCNTEKYNEYELRKETLIYIQNMK